MSCWLTVSTSLIVSLCSRSLSLIYIALSLAAVASRTSPLLKQLSEHGKTATSQFNEKKFPWIPKRTFLHFYTVGFIWMTLIITVASDCIPFSVVMTLMVHLLRRVYECVYVHKFTTNSKMHFVGWLLGVGHYLLLPFNFLGTCQATKTRLSGPWVFANLWLQYEQYRHHVFLSELRRADQMSSPTVPQKVQ